MEEGEKAWSLWVCYRGQWSVRCAGLQGPAGSSEIRKHKEISDFLFFLPIWFIQHNQAIPSLDTACPAPVQDRAL